MGLFGHVTLAARDLLNAEAGPAGELICRTLGVLAEKIFKPFAIGNIEGLDVWVHYGR